jgi:hypothetical protein
MTSISATRDNARVATNALSQSSAPLPLAAVHVVTFVHEMAAIFWIAEADFIRRFPASTATTTFDELVRVYGPRDRRDRGASIALNILDASGALRNCERVESPANERQISVRSGCHCNPGAREVALGYPRTVLAGCLKDTEHKPFEEFMRASRGCRDGVVRVSVGIASNFEHAYRFLDFARSFTDRHAPLDQHALFARKQCHGCRRWRGRTDGR